MLSVMRQRVTDVRSALWFRPAAFCLGVILLCIAIPLLAPHLPQTLSGWLPRVQEEAVATFLQVLAGSMLTAATVTLSVLMLALGLAVAHATPRAVPELMADPTTQNALGTFLATFAFSLGGLFLLGMELADAHAISLLYIVAMLLAAGAVVRLLQWFHHVAGVIRINKVVARIHRQSSRVLRTYFARRDESAGRIWVEDAAAARVPIHPSVCGYVQFIDVPSLDSLAERHGLRIEMTVREGVFVLQHVPVMQVETAADIEPSLTAQLASTLVVGPERSPVSDPLLGFELLAEVAVRALSAGINDPQTALICIDYLTDLLMDAAAVPSDRYPPERSLGGRVRLRCAGFDAMLERAFRPIMREAAASAEVIFAVADALALISRHCQPEFRALLAAEAQRSLDFGLAHLHHQPDKDRLRETVDGLIGGTEGAAG